MNQLNKNQFNVQRRWHSRKDYSFHKTFGEATPSEIPASLLFLSRILNQMALPACTAFTAVAIRESMKPGKQYDPLQQWQLELGVWGDPNAQGVDLETQMATGVEKGFVPEGTNTPTDNTAAYFTVTPTQSVFNPKGLDAYDAVKSAITLRKTPLSLGIVWYNEWVAAPGGIIPHTQNSVLGRHDTKIAGWATSTRTDGTFINPATHEEYLVIQGSWGQGVGDNGLFYFDRYMADLTFNQGIFYWTDTQGLNYQRLGLLMALLQNLKNLLTQFAPGVARAFGII